MNPPVALAIAGSDSGGGAGVQGDPKTFAALGAFATCAVTAVTAQNSTEVRCVVPVAPEMAVEQIEAVLDDMPVSATKTGMLATAATAAAVGALAAAGRLPPPRRRPGPGGVHRAEPARSRRARHVPAVLGACGDRRHPEPVGSRRSAGHRATHTRRSTRRGERTRTTRRRVGGGEGWSRDSVWPRRGPERRSTPVTR